MKVAIDLQVATEATDLPSLEQFEQWCRSAIQAAQTPAAKTPSDTATELTIRIVDSEESQQLNHDYRGKNSDTNVLSFPFEAPDFDFSIPTDAKEYMAEPFAEADYLGDLVICHEVMQREAKEQSKPELCHWAHLTIHGCLHLLGYDHIEDGEAEAMESLEIEILESLNIANPYAS